MLKIMTTTQFKKDLKRQAKRGCDIKKMEAFLDKLVIGEPLKLNSGTTS
jgi:mRNA-degrading endonuclease YafQ of YafQ-DinJ toxin-antitoxin module